MSYASLEDIKGKKKNWNFQKKIKIKKSMRWSTGMAPIGVGGPTPLPGAVLVPISAARCLYPAQVVGDQPTHEVLQVRVSGIKLSKDNMAGVVTHVVVFAPRIFVHSSGLLIRIYPVLLVLDG